MAMTTYTPAADKIVHSTNVDFTRRSYISAPIRLVQYDNTVPIIAVSLYKDNEPYKAPAGYDANIRVGRKAGHYVMNPAVGCSEDRGIIYFEVTSAMVVDHGKLPVVIELVNGESVAGSSTFIFDVDRNPAQLDDIDTSSEGKSLTNFVKDAQAAKEAAEKASKEAVSANGTAQDAMKEAVEAKDAIKETEYQLENAVQDINDSNLRMDSIENQFAALSLLMGNKIDGGYADEEGYLYLTADDQIVAGPIGPFAGGSGGGGGAGNNAVLTLTNMSGWMAKTVAKGSTCIIEASWSSIEQEMETGPGVLTVRINNIPKLTRTIQQGSFTVELKDILVTGQNSVKIQVADQYGNTRTIVFTVTAVELTLTSTFVANQAFSDAIQYVYTPTGSGRKTVHFIIDGKESSTAEVTSSNRQQTYTIQKQTHGHHTFEVYFTATVNEEDVESNHLYYDLICIESGKNAIIFAIPYNVKTVEQYDTVVIPWYVYDPNNLTATVEIYVNNGLMSTQTNVDRTQQTYSFRANQAGTLTVKFKSGDYEREITMNVTESEITIEAVTDDLVLYLTSEGRSNNEEDPAKWSYNDISVTFNENFNWITDGWVQDDDGNSVMRLTRGDSIEIPYKIFSKDFRTGGKTIEFEFATRDCGKYNNDIIEVKSDNGDFPGLVVSTNSMRFGSATTNFSYPFKEEEHIRVAIVVDKTNQNRLMSMYVNGIMSAAMQYSENDNFQQLVPKNITIKAVYETIDIYNIRIYDNNLTRDQVLDNWIADTQDGGLLRDRYTRNKIFDEYSRIVIDSLPNDVPYFIFEAEELPQSKGDKKDVNGSFTNRIQTSRSFTFTNASADVQGTSSAGYARKNYKVKFKNFITGTGQQETYAMNENAIPVNTFTFKADVASSEGANNICLAQLYNDICTYQTPPQKENPKVRQGIDGFAMVVFQTKSGETEFIGKYNFNNDKGTEDVFGFKEGDESWEVLNNTSDRVLFSASANYDDVDGMKVDFEGRYPDGNEDFSNLIQMFNDAKTKLLTKDGIAELFETDSAAFYYLFTEMFLMVDSRAKNMFLTKYTGGKWCFLPYDFDTALGINNEGSLAFPYWLEDSDILDDRGTKVFNGQDSVLWNKFKEFYANEIASLYSTLRSGGKFSYDTVEQRFEDHQSTWSEAIFNEDAWFKYIQPLVESNEAIYLPMLQGSKAEQRKWWLYNRFKYMDSKYVAGESLTNAITLRGYAKADISVKTYAPTYVSVKYGSDTETHRFKEGEETYKFECKVSSINDTEIYVYSADAVTNISDLSGFNVGQADFSKAVRIREVFVGNGDDISSVDNGLYNGEAFGGRSWNPDYQNTRLELLNVGNNHQLNAIDARNCVALSGSVDLRGCEFLRGVRFDGCTALGSIDLPNGAPIVDLYFPDNSVSIIVRNLKSLATDNFSTVLTAGHVTTLQIENTPKLMTEITQDLLTQHLTERSRLRLVGFDLEILPEVQEEDQIEAAVDAWLDLFDKYTGLDENGKNTDKAQIVGTWSLYQITGKALAGFKERYPGITFIYEHVTSTLTYCNWDGTQLYQETIQDNGDGTYDTTPTRESTAQYNFTFAGWTIEYGSDTPQPNATKNVGADRTVYACYTHTTRTYDVTFYNETQLLYTATAVPYGGTATYKGTTPTNQLHKYGASDPDNYIFKEWVPSNTNIQGPTKCVASWTYIGLTETLGDYSWQQIADICTAGLASTVFKENDGENDGDIKIAVGNGNIIGETGIDMELVIADNQDHQDYIPANTIWVSKHLPNAKYKYYNNSNESEGIVIEYSWYYNKYYNVSIMENHTKYKYIIEEINIDGMINIDINAYMRDYASFFKTDASKIKKIIGESDASNYFVPVNKSYIFNTSSNFGCTGITKNGSINNNTSAQNKYPIPVAFGLGDPARCHVYDEEQMKADIADGSYKEKYQLGDVVTTSDKYIGIVVSIDYINNTKVNAPSVDGNNIVILWLYHINTAYDTNKMKPIELDTLGYVNPSPHTFGNDRIVGYLPYFSQLDNTDIDIATEYGLDLTKYTLDTGHTIFDLFEQVPFIERFKGTVYQSSSITDYTTANIFIYLSNKESNSNMALCINKLGRYVKHSTGSYSPSREVPSQIYYSIVK